MRSLDFVMHKNGRFGRHGRRLLIPAALLLLGLLWANGLGSTASYHIDEGYYLLSGLTMVETGNFLYPVYEGQPRFQKPILPYWAVSLAYRLFGPGLATARLPSLVCALLTVVLTYRLGLVLWGSRPAALLSALALAANVMFFSFARLCLTDMMLTLMMTAALFFFARWYFEEPRRSGFLSLAMLAMAVAVMVKGILGLIIPLGTIGVFLARRHGRGALPLLAGLFAPVNLLIFLLVTLPWPLAMHHRFGEAFLGHVLLRETIERVGLSASTLAVKTLRYVWAIARYFFPWWLALVPLLPAVAKRRAATVGGDDGDHGDDGGRTLFLAVNVLTVLVLLLLAMRTYSFKYLLPLTPAFSLLVGRQLAGRAAPTHRSGRTLTAFHLGAAAFMGGAGIVGLALFLVGLRLPEFMSPGSLLLAALSVAGILLVRRLRSRRHPTLAAGAAACAMLWQLSIVLGTLLPLLRPDAASTLGERHLRAELRRGDRILTSGLDEKRRAWLSLAAGRVVEPPAPASPAARPGEPAPQPAAGRTYLVASEEELAALSAEARLRYTLVASASEFGRASADDIFRSLRQGQATAIPTRTYSLLGEQSRPQVR